MSIVAPERRSAPFSVPSHRTRNFRVPTLLAPREQAPIALRLGAAWKPLAEGPRQEITRPAIYETGRASHIPVWYSRAAWLHSVKQAFLSPTGRTHRRRLGGLSLKAFMAVMHEDANTADHGTGRNLYTSHSTVSYRTKLSVQVVQRARQICEHLGLSATIDPGRYLPAAERTLRTRRGGVLIFQIRKAATRVLTMPKQLVLTLPQSLWEKVEYLPRRGSSKKKLPSSSLTNARSRVPAMKKASPKKAAIAPASMAARTLAARLAATNHRLVPDRSLAKLSYVLEARLGADLGAWTVSKLIERIDQARMKLGFTLPDFIADGAAFMDWMLTQTDLTPPQTREQILAARQAAIEANRAAKARLEAAASLEARAQRAAGAALCRAALKQARTKNTQGDI